jgi:hypothetical protein
MATLLSTTQFVGQMGYQIASDKKLKCVCHKKANWFKKHTTQK